MDKYGQMWIECGLNSVIRYILVRDQEEDALARARPFFMPGGMF